MRAALKKRLARQEHDHELGRVVELAPVRLAAEAGQVVAHLPRVVGERAQALGLVLRFDRVEIRGQRGLGVHDDALVAGEADHEIGPHAHIVHREGFLLDEVGVLDHPGELDDLAELDLTPVPADVRLTQRLHQAAGFALQRGEPCAEGAQLLSQRRGGRHAILLDVDHPGVHGLQRLRDRADHLRDRLLALLEVSRRALVELLERRGREGDHGFRVCLQRFGRRGPEDVAELLFGAIEQRLPVVGRFEACFGRGRACRGGRRRLSDFATFLLPDDQPG